MSSSKTSRAAPARRFEEYTLTHDMSSRAGLYPIATTKMTQVPTAGVGGGTSTLSGNINIGFDFNLDVVTYKQFVVSSSGFMALVDPATGTYAETVPYDEPFLMPSGFVANTALLCPWYSFLTNVYETVESAYPSLSSFECNRIRQGFDTPGPLFNPTSYGIKYANVVDETGQRCLIVRWFSLFGSQQSGFTTKMCFDVVLYENGTIEYRYAPCKKLTLVPLTGEYAIVGIFLNATVWRFRDASYGLGYRDDARQMYVNGGYTYVTGYTDDPEGDSLPLSYGLTSWNNWPGLAVHGCVMSFTPPVNLRHVLPRKDVRVAGEQTFPLTLRTGDVRIGNDAIVYDDRNTLEFVSGNVNYPTRLPKFHGDGASTRVTDRRDLYGSFDVTASAAPNISDGFLTQGPAKKFVGPFVDHQRPEQDGGNFYDAGSSLDQFGDVLTNVLKSKTQIRVELPVEYPTTMPDCTSSIYYYNGSTRSWLLPQRSGNGLDIVDPVAPITFQYYPEDARGFGAMGNVISSGSNPSALGFGWQSDLVLGTKRVPNGGFNFNRQSEILTTYFAKSVQNNPEYNALPDEQFTLPIGQPFLVEKVVFEIPFTFGVGWFNDRTTSGCPMNNAPVYGVDVTIFDVAGPGITVALFNQVTAGPYTTRDLIVTGVIIPTGDNHSNVKMTVTSVDGMSTSSLYVFAPEGFPSYGMTPAAVVSSTSNEFTGTVQAECVAGISNGLMLSLFGIATAGFTGDPTTAEIAQNRQQVLTYLTKQRIGVNTQDYTLDNSTLTFIKDVDTFGRGAKSFDPSGRSVFGKEFVTSQCTTGDGLFHNPLYVSATLAQLPVSMQSALAQVDFAGVIQTAVPLSITFPSPYLVMPGDKLTLAISKMRPSLFSIGSSSQGAVIDHFTASLRHDVMLNVGSINITLYGSLLQNGREYHDTLNQPLCTNDVHEIIGNDPILDQFDVEPRSSYYGSLNDDYVTGSFVKKMSSGGSVTLVTGTRGRVFSMLEARSQLPPASAPNTCSEVLNNTSKAFRLQPWWERVRGSRNTQVVSLYERYYDSMMPALNDCFKADGSSMWIADPHDPPAEVDWPQLAVNRNNVGFLFFNPPATPATPIPDDAQYLFDRVWMLAYPFESRYANVQRQLIQEQSYEVDRMVDSSLNVTKLVPSVRITTFLPYCLAANSGIWCDVDLRGSSSPYYITGSMTPDDMARAMYGFGDNHGLIPYPVPPTGNTYGVNNIPQFRDNNFPSLPGVFGPIIRGWKYGVHNGLPTYSAITFRRNCYGQFRDILEQRPFAKFYQAEDTLDAKKGIMTGPVTVLFFNASGSYVDPVTTASQNLSNEATSSLPYFDGEARNRPITP